MTVMARPDPEVKDALLTHLRRHHPALCRHWFDDIEPLDVSGGTLQLLVRETVQLKYLRRCCLDQFTEAAQAVTGRLLAVRFVGEGEFSEETATPGAPTSGLAPSQIELAGLDEDMLLSPDYSFENFVMGPGNRLAHAAAIAVARKPGKAYNPFFIHASVGLGKTHLLQAICQTAMRDNPRLTLYYTSCEGFMTQFMEAVRAGKMSSFRHRFRNVDMLVIDDIHDLSKRDRTQDEFFHTFNSLYQASRQIVLSSDAPPNEIPDLEERLTSRFNCGLVAHIDKPCYETRVEIVKSKAALRSLRLPEDVASYVASRIDTNIRELEGAINKLQNHAMVGQEPLDLKLAQKVIGEQSAPTRSQHPTIQQIIDAIIQYYDVKLTDLLSKRRHKSIALPRQVGMWLARKHTRYSLEEIGGYFGGRDHTTVMHAIKAVNTKRQGDAALDHDVSRLEQQITAGHATPGVASGN
ncbi:MAG: chromosomal replication initiator protein DnaA [Phycisphaerales bacterium]|nr:chromosomal replication initiator protein DnaA [Phycisphaerae bacterium]NNF43715.1 chromosomal replication initiator protein DnaA [Phycisphaerales bacterium]NNM25304.1 chromosomal replication initiator protein DnaA [Phycisphaerales bacterium]